MKTSPRKRKSQDSGEDLWSWAERCQAPVPVIREDRPLADTPPWYRGVLRKLSSQKV